MAAALALAMWWRPGRVRVPWSSQQKGYPCIHFLQHEKDQAVTTAQDHAIVLDPLPCCVAHGRTPGLNSMLLIGYSASHGQVGGCVTLEGGASATGQAVKVKVNVYLCVSVCVSVCG